MIYPVTAITLVPSQVTFIPIDIFYKAVKANPDMALYLVQFFLDQLKFSENRMKISLDLPAKDKVAVALRTIIDSFGFVKQDPTLLAFSPSRKDIANLGGTTYETVIRVLSDLERLKIIQLEGKAIRVLDVTYLRSIGKNYL